MTQFISDIEGSHNNEPPKIIEQYNLHSGANKHMQQLFDDFIKENEESIIDKDDSDAGHFYACGDDGTQHWYIIEAK